MGGFQFIRQTKACIQIVKLTQKFKEIPILSFVLKKVVATVWELSVKSGPLCPVPALQQASYVRQGKPFRLKF